MLVWAIYDISSNKIRSKVAKLCQQYGLYRVQKSVFLGDMPSNRIDELVLHSEELLDTESDSLYVFPMCRKDFAAVRTVGQAIDQELVTDEIRQLLL